MALLPLAGWAAIDITNFTVTLTTVSYQYSGGTPTISDLTVTNPTGGGEITASCDLVYYNKAGQEIPAAQVKNAGTYKVAARAKADQDAYTGTTSAKIEFNITPKVLTVKYKKDADTEAAANVTLDAITFGEPMPVINKDWLVVTGWIDDDDADLLDKSGFTATQTKTDATVDPNGNALSPAKQPYEYELKGLVAGDNYAFEFPTIKLNIKQVALAETPANVTSETRGYFTYAVDNHGAKAYEYNSKVQAPTYTVKYIDAQGNEHSLYETTEGGAANVKDFTVGYEKTENGSSYGSSFATTRANVKNAGWYLGKISAEATGNFSGSVALTEDDFEFQITKKPVSIFVENMEGKVYDGDPIPTTLIDTNGDDEKDDITVNGAKVQIPRLETADAGLINNIKVHFAKASYNAVSGGSATAIPKDAGTYTLKPYAVGTGLGDNYDTTDGFLEVGSYIISQRPVIVKAKDQTFTYTGTKQTLATDVDYEGDDANVEFLPIEGNAKSGVISTEKATLANLFTIAKNGTYDILNVENAKYTNGIKVTPKDDTKNYEITPKSGNVIVNAKGLVVIAPTFTKEYGYQLKAADLAPIISVNNISLGGTPQYTIKNAAGKEFHVGDYLPVEADNYVVTIDPTSINAPTNYAISRIEEGKITITTKALKFTVKNQTLPKNASEDALVQGDNYVTIDGVKKGEKVLFQIKGTGAFSTANVSTDSDDDGVIDPVEDAITVKLYTQAEINAMVTAHTLTEAEAAQYSNKNYTLAEADITLGNLYVVAEGTIVLNRSEVNLADFINSNKSADDNDGKKVTFSDRKLFAETWQAYVLPFAVTPAKLCAGGLGYVIVNTLKPTSTASNVKFGYTMKEIPAYTPFIMKSAEAKNMSELILDGVIIEAVPATIVAQNNAKDVNFYGILAPKAGPFAANEYVMYNEAGENNKWVSEYQYGIGAMSGYLELPAETTAPVFTVEDENGTTSILGITTDGRIVEAEGWYTLNGVKLQGVPTQKGIYIHNGKKLVVK